jgi:hypothetical protein
MFEHFCDASSTSSTATQTNLTIKYSYENELANRSVKENMKQKECGNAENENESEVLLHRRLNPKSKEDFKNLHEDIEKWRDMKLKELDNDQEKMTKKDRAEFWQRIIDDELKLLQKVESLRTAGRKNYSKQKVQRYLDDMSNDIVWETNSGEQIRVEFSSKRYASKLAHMYITLRDFDRQEGKEFVNVVVTTGKSFALFPTILHFAHTCYIFNITVTTRLGHLVEAKTMLESISIPGAKDTIELIHRECDLLNRNMSQSLSGLRERMLNLFLQVIERETGKPIGSRASSLKQKT